MDRYRGMILLLRDDGYVDWMAPGDTEIRGHGTSLENAKFLIDGYLDQTGMFATIDYEVPDIPTIN